MIDFGEAVQCPGWHFLSGCGSFEKDLNGGQLEEEGRNVVVMDWCCLCMQVGISINHLLLHYKACHTLDSEG